MSRAGNVYLVGFERPAERLGQVIEARFDEFKCLIPAVARSQSVTRRPDVESATRRRLDLEPRRHLSAGSSSTPRLRL